MRRFKDEQKEKRLRRSKVTLVFIWAVVASLVGVKVYFANSFVSSGQDLAALKKEIDDLRQENYLLKEEAAEWASLLSVEKKAVELGMEKSQKIVLIKTETSLAYTRD